MDKWFNSKWFVRVISLAFAILLYVFVNIEASSTQSDSRVPGQVDRVQSLNDVPVGIRIDADRYVVSGVPEYVTATLEGPNAILTSTAMQRNFELFVDLRNLEEGTHVVDIEYARVPDELSIYIDPKTIEVFIEERATEAFPISIDFINEDRLPEGYELQDPVIEPETVSITSSRSVIDQIGIVKIFVDVAELTEPIRNREVPINVYDIQGNGLNVRMEPDSAIVSVDIVQPSKVVPIEVLTEGELPEGYTLESIMPEIEEIEIFARTQILDTIDVLYTEPIDLTEISEAGALEVTFDIPEGVRVETETIEVDVQLEHTILYEDVPITVERSDEQEVNYLDPEIPAVDLVVTGPEEILRELAVEDFRLFVDVSELPEGEHRIPIIVEVLEDIDDDTIEASIEHDHMIIQIVY